LAGAAELACTPTRPILKAITVAMMIERIFVSPQVRFETPTGRLSLL
jgi:hypothetical protein